MSRKFTFLTLAALMALVMSVRAQEVPHVDPPEEPHPVEALSSLPVPQPSDLYRFVRDKDAAIVLGKTLFWDMQAGSDGVQACASCHFHAGADNRTKNQLNPGTRGGDSTFQIGGPNYDLQPDDYPFHLLADPADRKSEVLFDTNDVVSSMGVHNSTFNDIVPGSDVDNCDSAPDPIFNIDGVNTRRVEPRNTPSTIGAIYNFRNFWDGRASFYFNGVNPVGPRDPDAYILEAEYPGGPIEPVSVLIDNASMASQAVGPPMSNFEMSCAGRSFAKLGKKMLHLDPLGKQVVATTDSVLGPYAKSARVAGAPGISVSYRELIETAFNPVYWDSDAVIRFDSNGDHIIGADGIPANTDEYTMMEANFSLFWGLAIQLYEATLIPDQTPFDVFMEGGGEHGTAAFMLDDEELAGMKLFFGGQAKCSNCHAGPEFSGAAASNVGRMEPADIPGNPPGVEKLIEIMPMADNLGAAYDNGFYNIGVRPTEEDLGVGGEAAGPICFSRRSEMGLPIPEQDVVDQPLSVDPGFRVACDGAFKTPQLRNVEFTAPYFHNGGTGTLREMIEFYNRGGDFSDENIADLDPDITQLGLTDEQIDQLVAFMRALTDERVRFESDVFDHPELYIPVGHPDGGPFLKVGADRIEALYQHAEADFLPTAEVSEAAFFVGTPQAEDLYRRLPPTGHEGNCVGIDGTESDEGFIAAVCDDENACTLDYCDPQFDCMHVDISCDDMNVCTVDTCDKRLGCQNEEISCDDGNPCTVDTCDAVLGCLNTPHSGACDDGNVCTVGDVCDGAGACVPGTPTVCSDGDVCTSDACDAELGCNFPSSGVCESMTCFAAGDASASFAGDMVADASYSGGADADADRDSLTSPLVYSTSSLQAFRQGSGDQVTYTIEIPSEGDYWAHGRMYFPGAPNSNDANSFWVSVDAGTAAKFGNNKDYFQTWHWGGDGNIESGPSGGAPVGVLSAGTHTVTLEKREVLPAGTAPRLDMICLSRNGAEAPSDEVALGVAGLGGCASNADCTDGNGCTDDVCEVDGSCSFTNNTASCDDGIGCTSGDVCSDGVCAGTEDCADGESCNYATGICAAPLCTSNEECADYSACTDDVCDPTIGCLNIPISCDDSDGCTIDSCDALLGCQNEPVVCDDGLNCTTEACVDGGCVFTDACPAGSVCNIATDTCDLDTGLVCIAAGSDPTLVVSGAMVTGGEFTGGSDLDSERDNLTAPLLYAASTQNAFNGESGDEASYTIVVPEAGEYDLWGRLYYDGESGSNIANSFLVRMNGGAATSFGNNRDMNGLYHWDGDGAVQEGPVAGLPVGTLEAGAHSIVIEKREVNPVAPRLDVLCLSPAGNAAPSDEEALAAMTRRFCVEDAHCQAGELCTSGVCVPEVLCVSDSECDDGNACTDDECAANGCVNRPVSCDDGDACTVDSCDLATGGCNNDVISCDDGDACTVDTCDAVTGCANDAVVCGDGEFCNAINGACEVIPAAQMVCVAADDISAVFSGAMTADAAFSGGNDPDAELDSISDVMAYAASTTNSFSAGSGDEVTYDINVPAAGHYYAWARMLYPSQSGGNAANSFFLSVDGAAAAKLGNNKDMHQRFHWDGDGNYENGPVVSLEIGMLEAGAHSITVEKREVLPVGEEPRLDVICLTEDGVNPPSDADVIAHLSRCKSDAVCDDDNLCTVDSCDLVSGECSNTPIDCSLLDDQCNVGVCDGQSGVCVAEAQDGQACNDGNACTGGDSCDAAGTCLAGAAVNCDDGNACTLDTCDLITGCSNEPIPGCVSVSAIPDNLAPAPGTTFVAEVVIDAGYEALGAYSTRLECDDSVMEIEAVAAGASIEFAEPISNQDGACSVALTDFQADSTEGPSGAVSVARVTIRVKETAAAGAEGAIRTITQSLASTEPEPIEPVADVETSITVGP